ncbi:type II toxin-antitoxin system PemK/MazF family toxin [Allomesorhizobium camelthorni]|jgi:mRNA interferase MazF|uniref:Type II toxin-antitoxin system PemK/MazF family toxin n=1 Tax=Allomesorhizobium camelthorni TaxID=475069 RepID=A0A6G4W8U0_9HYPH|nr:type II toxin-antitoxin system PemK/MazF family toxin [Mesorhizobium camelthorni]NGO50656.1 type II toxin-antitoxin system PemK/MazF family toxin [Mesorhizobium camelthorni]
MRRGDLVIVSAKGDYGKPRPAVVIQNDRLEDWVESLTVCFLTTDLTTGRNLRVDVEPNSGNGLHGKSQVQIEKIMTFPKDKARGPVGRLSSDQMRAVDRGLLLLLDLLPPIEIPRVP